MRSIRRRVTFPSLLFFSRITRATVAVARLRPSSVQHEVLDELVGPRKSEQQLPRRECGLLQDPRAAPSRWSCHLRAAVVIQYFDDILAFSSSQVELAPKLLHKDPYERAMHHPFWSGSGGARRRVPGAHKEGPRQGPHRCHACSHARVHSVKSLMNSY